MKKWLNQGAVRFLVGMAIGYCVVQGVAYANQHYFWAFFYR